MHAWSADAQNGNLTKLTVTTDGDIPRQPDPFIGSNPVAGLAWAAGSIQ